MGVGAGLSQPTSDYDAAPLLALHAAYGLSDAVDARATFAGSLHSAKNPKWDERTLTLATLGLAYKLDVIEWVPYIGVRAGYFYFGPPLPDESDGKSVYAKSGGSLGIMAGIDYSFTRSFAVGVELARDLLLPEGQVNSGILHAEYRFGF